LDLGINVNTFNFVAIAVPDVPVIRIIPTYSQQEKILLGLSVTIMELVRYTIFIMIRAILVSKAWHIETPAGLIEPSTNVDESCK
jgi:hypothetical protein